MRRTSIAAAFALASCYSIHASAPPGATTMLASANELCTPVMHTRVHYALAGLIPLGDNHVTVPPGGRVRVVTEADGLDVILRALGYAFTWGLYGGTQSATVEVCGPMQVAGAPGMTPAPAAAPMPMPVYAAPQPAPAPTYTVVLPVSPGYGDAPAPAMRRPARDTDQPMCKYGTDCEQGAWCRDRGDGVHVCMGDGGHDDFCSSSIDCGSGLFCRDGGDGYKRCM